MCVFARLRLLFLAALPAFVGKAGWCAGGEVVSVTEAIVGGGFGPSGPAFVTRQHTSVMAALGEAATLDCRVMRLGDKSVSWVRTRDLQILSHAGAVFTADARVSATSGRSTAGVSKHSLHIERLREADAGRYECQVNTEPKMSLFFNLTVLDEPMPVVAVSAVGPRTVNGVVGGSATLGCEARYDPQPKDLPLAPLDIRWYKEQQLIDLQNSGGGVSLETERWGWRASSRLTLAHLAAADAGAFRCVAQDAQATIRLRISENELEGPMEAMQRDETAARPTGGVSLARLNVVLLASVLLLTRGLLDT